MGLALLSLGHSWAFPSLFAGVAVHGTGSWIAFSGKPQDQTLVEKHKGEIPKTLSQRLTKLFIFIKNH